jgi:prevent-host-death family protein
MKGAAAMMQIRPVSDLRNKFPEIESAIGGGQPVYLTKNGYGAMVVMSLEKYAELTDDLELKLDEADRAAALSDIRYSHEEVFASRCEGCSVLCARKTESHKNN